MGLSAAQILDLAPDAPSRKAGQDQAKPHRWSGPGRSGDLVWGEITGSGASPYRTVADLSGPASKCTCPSRKSPCKHALGLMLVDAASPSALPAGEPPDWVAAWARARAGRVERAEARAEGGRDRAAPADGKAQARRRRAREERVAAALDGLDLWLGDLMRRGLSGLRAEPYAFWDRVAGRLVDGQAPGLARRVRARAGLAAAPARGGARPGEALALALGRLALLVRAARRLDALEPEQAAGVRAAIGHPVPAEALAARPGAEDAWAVLAQVVEEEDGLTARSVWLVGRAGGRVARLLDYAAPGSPLPPAPAAGQDFTGALAFHPGDPPLRAVLRGGLAGPSPPEAPPGAGGVRDALADWAGALARAPWIERWPLRLRGVRLGLLPGAGEPELGAGDATGCLALARDHRWRALVAVAAGRPVDLFGLYDGRALAVLSLMREGRLYTAPPGEAGPCLARAA